MHPVHETSMHYFSCTGGTRTYSTKKCTRTHYVKLVFLHPVGSTGHVVHSGASRVQNIDTLFFMLEWAGAASVKSASGHVAPNLCFCIRWDQRSRSAFWCVRGMTRRCTIFHARVGPVRFPKKRAGTRYAKLVFLLPVGYAGHVVYTGASGARNVNALFFMFGWDQYRFHKKRRTMLG
jgi:hypothetical protein